MKRFKTMQEIREAVRSGQQVYWSNTGYIVFEEPISTNTETRKAQEKFPAVKDGMMLVARYKSNWFGGCLEESEVSACFTEELT